MAEFVWELCGPMFRPDTFDANNLGLDYTDGADARFASPGLVVGPSPTDLDCTSAGTAGNTNCGVMVKETAGSAYFLILGNGDRYTKLIVPTGNSALSKASTQPGSSFAARIQSMVVTKHTGGNPMVSCGLEATNTYQNITAVAAENASDTTSACNETSGGGQSRILGLAPDRMAGFNGQKFYGNVLTASVTADASSWQEISGYSSADIIPTGFAMSENLWLVGTNIGALVLNAQYKEFFLATPEVPASLDNCRAMRYIPYLGALIPLVGQLRLQNGALGLRVGPEAFNAPNTVQGTVTGIGYNADWTFAALRNPKTSTTYILAGRPREAGAWHGNPISWYCIDSFSNACEWVEVLRDPGAIRTNQVLAVGNADDLRYYRIGRTLNWTDDVSGTDNYLFTTTAQNAYGNRMHFHQPMDITHVRFTGTNLAAARTITVKIQYQTARMETGTATVTVENSTGQHFVKLAQPIRDVNAFNPVVTLSTNVTSGSPVLEHGRISIYAEPSK